ncbi:MAG TPA: RNA pseudouridine synthase, partial [Allosphingosinicella sp.]
MLMWDDKILFIDGEAIILDKPAGLAVHPGKGPAESLEDYLPDLRFGFQRAPTPVHRLDRDTSGCLLLARNPKAHKRFAAAFEARQVEKVYAAILDGVPQGGEGRIDLPLAKISSRERGWRIVPDPAGKPAVTHWRVAAVREGRIDLPLAKVSSRERGWRIVPDPAGKPAVTHWRVAAVREERALVL